MSKRFYNCHAHCFTYDHVPEHFLSSRVAVSWLLKRKWLKKLIHDTPVTGKFGFIGSVLIFILSLIMGLDKEMAIRYLTFIKYGDKKKQDGVIKSITAYYPDYTGYVFLTMDLEYMGAGLPKTRFVEQLKDLEGVKRNPAWQHMVYPFIFCDPRRLQPLHKRELEIEKSFIGPVFENKLKQYITDGIYQGIKIYPALGYYPFDKRMKSVLDFAAEGEVPIMTHCTIGAVHFKYKLDEEEYYHPFLKTNLPDSKPKDFQQYFTHPLNFECLMNQSLLKTYWGADAPDYSNLKICLGHWGPGSDWHSYLNNAWGETSYRKRSKAFPSLEISNWRITDKPEKNFSWFTIICDLMRKYPNVYADISFTLNDASLFPLLKMILEADEKIRQRVLFGTDFYMVSKSICERKFAINVRAYLGIDLFNQIAIVNAERFLNTKFNKVVNEFWEENEE